MELIINKTIGSGKIESYEMKTTIKTNNRSPNLSELNINKKSN